MWHDNETTVDYVNFRLVAKACAELIRDTGGEPISIGISGGWGAGKSSLVRMIESELSPRQDVEIKAVPQTESNYVVVTFNPWLFVLALGLLLGFKGCLQRYQESSALHPFVFGLGCVP
ncbi:P-loop NTPase fold protein, partial [Xenorhabdus cabanillasii]|uniref:P-loop NTPase fold protein n=1 Tax=Xenorhabdus cabanillasii TaxID=351673 RepID=UPI000570FFE6